jgi:Holliday junction DNA helicase RuvB
MVPTINHWIGQAEAIARFRIALEAAWNDSTRLPHMLFVGGPGLGKTELAHLAAREMGVTIHERLAQVVSSMAAMNGLLLQAADKQICFLDEIHDLMPNVQTVLYRAMEGGQISLQGRDNHTMTMPLRDFTIIGATTDEFRLLSPLRDRFKMVLPFVEYDVESLATITLQRARMLGIELDEQIGREIALRSKGTPRLAIRLLESCHRYARAQGDDRITLRHFNETLTLDGLDSLGLGPDEQRYLRFLAERNGDPVRLFTLASALGIHHRTIQSVIEPFLIKSGLVERHSQGRTITKAGLRHLGLIHDPKVSVA